MDVSENSGTPKSSILIGFSIINHPFWVPLFLETPIYVQLDSFALHWRGIEKTMFCAGHFWPPFTTTLQTRIGHAKQGVREVGVFLCGRNGNTGSLFSILSHGMASIPDLVNNLSFGMSLVRWKLDNNIPPDRRAVFWSCGWTVIMSLVEWNRIRSWALKRLIHLPYKSAKFKTCLRLGPSNVPFSHLRSMTSYLWTGDLFLSSQLFPVQYLANKKTSGKCYPVVIWPNFVIVILKATMNATAPYKPLAVVDPSHLEWGLIFLASETKV